MDKIWLKKYPPSVPAEIDAGQYTSINDMLERSFRDFADRPAFASFGHKMSYAEVDRLSRDFAAYLQSLPGLEKGSRVALMMPNILSYPVALFGVLRAGMVVVNVNPLYTPRELEHQLDDSGAEAIVVVSLFAATVRAVVTRTVVKHVIETGVADLLGAPKRWLINYVAGRKAPRVSDWPVRPVTLRAALAAGAKLPLADAAPTHDTIAFLQYTGGTTGRAKGAVLTHGNIVANVIQGQAWLGERKQPQHDIVITALPLYHIYALTVNCFSYLRRGGLNVLIANPRDLPGFVKELKKWPFTAITGVNTLYNGLLHTPGFSDIDFSRLELAMGGGAAIQRPVAERWKEATGVSIMEGYGLSETSPIATSNLTEGEFTGGIGYPIPSTEVKICDDTGKEVPLGTEGEICVRGPQVMQGYWNRPEETEAAFTQDGFFRTGDIGVMDEDGLIRLTDRKKDIILVSGFNVYPSEIEEVIAGHPGVMECAVIGVPDEQSGEVVKAFVVRKDPDLSAEAVRAYCKENLTGYKVPKQIEFRDSLPKTPIGKILRRELREETSKAAAE